MQLSHDGLPVARCGVCKRDVLTHVRIDREGALARCCVECDGPIAADVVAWVSEETFRLGGDPDAALDNRGCGSGGCGSGMCGRR